MSDTDLTDAATKTYLYGYPLVYNLTETQHLLDGSTPIVPDGATLVEVPTPRVEVPTPRVEVDVSDDLRWWEQFRVALAAFPPPSADAEFVGARYDILWQDENGDELDGGHAYELPKVRKLAAPR